MKHKVKAVRNTYGEGIFNLISRSFAKRVEGSKRWVRYSSLVNHKEPLSYKLDRQVAAKLRRDRRNAKRLKVWLNRIHLERC